MNETTTNDVPRERETWRVRREERGDRAAVHAVNTAAFGTPAEAELVDRLREENGSWLRELSWVALDPEGEVVAYALLTRCRIGGRPALALAPVAVAPDRQRRGAGGAVVRAVLDAARERGERLVVVLGHAEYYPRFGFRPAAGFGIRAPFPVPEENLLALALDERRGLPTGTIRYADAFGL